MLEKFSDSDFFCRKFFPAWAAVGGQKGGEALSKASENYKVLGFVAVGGIKQVLCLPDLILI